MAPLIISDHSEALSYSSNLQRARPQSLIQPISFDCGKDESRKYTAIIYSAQFKVDFKHPLNDKEYIGQCVRLGSVFELLTLRRREHERLSVRKEKEFGFHALLSEFGNAAFEWKVLDSCEADRTEASEWANLKEITAIADRGGPLKAWMGVCDQTLNLQVGGTGVALKYLYYMILRSDKAWSVFLEHLGDYKASHGSLHVPRSYVCDDGYQLGNHLNNTRSGKVFVRGRPERVDLLVRLGVIMKYRDEWRDSKWEVFSSEVLSFVMAHGHADVPQKYTNPKTGYKLGIQVNDLRTKKQYLSKRPERIQFLEEIGFKWSIQKEKRELAWLTFVAHLKRYKGSHGHLCIPHGYVTPCGFKLGYASSNCKTRADYHRFVQDRLKLLVEMEFPLSAKVLQRVEE